MAGEAVTAVFGLTTYNGQEHLAEAIESLLGQSRDDLAIVIVDDASGDSTGEIARRYAAFDPRVSYDRNDRQLGLVRNWRRALRLAVERFPDAPYFAWASDHDVWHPRWLESTAAELDAHPEAVLAYPLGVRIDGAGSEYPTRERPFGTEGVVDPVERVRRTARDMTAAGEMIYGLMRRESLLRAGEYPLVVLADRLQLLRLAAEGEFRQVDRRLWYRRYRAGVTMTNSRQRAASFPGGAPLVAYVPWPVTHAAAVGRSGGARLGGVVLQESAAHAWERSRRRGQRRRRWRRRERRQRLARMLGHGGPPGQVAVSAAEEQPPGAAEAVEALERAEVLDGVATVVDLGDGSLAAELVRRTPGVAVVDPGTRADLAVGLDALGGVDVGEVVGRLYELGVPTLYTVDRETPELREALDRRYWLRDVWAPPPGATGRKPDPTTGPVPREPDRHRHVVGRRRLLL